MSWTHTLDMLISNGSHLSGSSSYHHPAVEHSRQSQILAPYLPPSGVASPSPVPSSIGQLSAPDHDSSEDSNFSKQRKSGRDPLSHRLIEKRRRDRMNSCLADLSRLIPPAYLKKGKGRIEKTEIVEMAIKHLKHLESHNKNGKIGPSMYLNGVDRMASKEEMKRQFKIGYQEAMSEAIRFMVEFEGLFAGDGLCLRMVNHLHSHLAKLDTLETALDSDKVEKYAASKLAMFESSTNSKSIDQKPSIAELNQKVNSLEPNGLTDQSMDIEDCADGRPPYAGSQLRKMLEAKENGSNNTIESQKSSISPMTAPSPTPSIKSANSPFSETTTGGRKNYKKEIRERFQATLSNSSSSSSEHQQKNRSASINVELENVESSGISRKPRSESENGASSSNLLLLSSTNKAHSFKSSSNYKVDLLTSMSGGRSMSACATAGCSSSCSCRAESVSSSTSSIPSANPSLVPGFALHPTGSFYVPIRIEPHLVARFLTADTLTDGAPFPILHPINIAVSFANSSILWPNGPPHPDHMVARPQAIYS